ncbi:MAG: helix-turn-helix transcriptional regulator [Patescibacteria group bacterium]
MARPKLDRGYGRKGTFRYFITRERSKRDLTLEDAVKLFKNRITGAYLGQIEAGFIPSPKVVKTIAEAYSLDIDEMLRITFMQKNGSTITFVPSEQDDPFLQYLMREIEKISEPKKTQVIKMCMDVISLSKM